MQRILIGPAQTEVSLSCLSPPQPERVQVTQLASRERNLQTTFFQSPSMYDRIEDLGTCMWTQKAQEQEDYAED